MANHDVNAEFLIKEEETCTAIYSADENQHMPEYDIHYTGYLIVWGIHYGLSDQLALKTAFLYAMRDSCPDEWDKHVDDVVSYFDMMDSALQASTDEFTGHEPMDDLPF